jgi:uncharacterized membrane protein
MHYLAQLLHVIFGSIATEVACMILVVMASVLAVVGGVVRWVELRAVYGGDRFARDQAEGPQP